MQLKALLDWSHPAKVFVYEKVQSVEDRQQLNVVRLTVQIRPRQDSYEISEQCVGAC